MLSGQLIVPQNETVDTALIFHGPASIEGTVTGSVIVFDGRTDVSGRVEGDVVVFNGAVTVRSGAGQGDLVTTDTPTVEPGATIAGQRQRVATTVRRRGHRVRESLRLVGRLLDLHARPRLLLLLIARPGWRDDQTPGADRRVDAASGSRCSSFARRASCSSWSWSRPAGTVPVARAGAPLHGRLRRGRACDRTEAGEAADVPLPRVPPGVGHRACSSGWSRSWAGSCGPWSRSSGSASCGSPRGGRVRRTDPAHAARSGRTGT